MYDAFFQLNERPFAATPQTERYVPACAIEAARLTLTRCADRAEGTGVLIGPSGSGKTLLCHMLREHFQSEYAVAMLGTTRLDSPRALLQAMLFDLSLPCRGMDDGELRLTLIDYLNDNAKSQRGMLLVVDEMHTLPARVLEEVRLITNVSVSGRPRVRLVLAGSPVLEERLASPKLESFSQRTAARCYLEPFNRSETFEYVRANRVLRRRRRGDLHGRGARSDVSRHRWGAATDQPSLRSRAGAGVFTRAASARRRRDRSCLGRPATTPHPVDANASGAAADDVIQFGQLDDELDEPIRPSTMSAASVSTHSAASTMNAGAAACPHRRRFRALAHGGSRDPRRRRTPIQLDRSWLLAPGRGPDSPKRDSSDPFAESFDEEEVIVDRFGMSHTAFWDQMPQVYSVEGEVLSSLLAPYVEVARPVQLGVVSSYEAPASAAKTTRWQPRKQSRTNGCSSSKKIRRLPQRSVARCRAPTGKSIRNSSRSSVRASNCVGKNAIVAFLPLAKFAANLLTARLLI